MNEWMNEQSSITSNRSLLLQNLQQNFLLYCSEWTTQKPIFHRTACVKELLPFREWWPCHPRPPRDSSWTVDFYAIRNRQSSAIKSAFKVRYKLLIISIRVFFSFATQTWLRECGVYTISSAAWVQNNAAVGSGGERQHCQLLRLAPTYA